MARSYSDDHDDVGGRDGSDIDGRPRERQQERRLRDTGKTSLADSPMKFPSKRAGLAPVEWSVLRVF